MDSGRGHRQILMDAMLVPSRLFGTHPHLQLSFISIDRSMLHRGLIAGMHEPIKRECREKGFARARANLLIAIWQA